MTPEELETAVREQSAEELAEFFESLTEADRKKLAKAAVAVKRKATEGMMGAIHSLNKDYRNAHAFQVRADLAILALCAWTEARRVASHLFEWNGRLDYASVILRILRARKPDWLDRWVAKELEGRGNEDWRLLRQLIREALCSRPTNDAYIVKMVQRYAGFRPHQDASLAETLKADPGLLEHEVWRIFEVDPGNDTLLNEGDVHQAPSGTPVCWLGWAGSLKVLSQEGRLDRGRLLRASLAALNRALQPKNTSWFWKFHESLQPTIEERVGLQSHYMKLLASPVPPVVGFAIDALLEVGKASKLDEAGLVEAVGPVFQLRPKLQPLNALRLLKQAARQPAVKSPVARAATAALQHEKTEVQETALDLLEELADPGCVAALETRLETLAPSLHGRARILLHRIQGLESPMSAPVSEPPDVLAMLDTIRAEAASMPEAWRGPVEIDALCKGELRPVRLELLAIPRLDPAARITPIHDLDELMEGLSAAVENLQDADEFERLLNGMSRLFHPRPADFQARTAPLVQRIRKLTEHWSQLRLLNLGLRFGLFSLINCWCNGTPPFETDPEKSGGPLWFLAYRLRELTLRIWERKPAPLLASPTHRHGWLEPVELVGRLRWWHEHHLHPDKHDLIQALLRLTPDGRELALQSAHDLPGESGAALRYALGGDLVGQLDVALFLAASRARQPRGEIPELDGCKAAVGPDGRSPCSYRWSVRKVNRGWRREVGMGLGIDDVPALSCSELIGSHPTMLLHQTNRREYVNDTLEHRWAATVWPHNLDCIFAHGAISVDRRLDDTASPYTGNSAFVEPLLDPDTPFSEMAQLLLAVSLVSRDADVSGLAVDALIQAIGDGRCTGYELGGILGRLLTNGLAKPNRLAKSLETAARGSPLHMHVCSEMVQTLIATQPSWPKDLHHLLAALQEWLAALQQPIRSELRQKLENVKSSGKTEALARKLLERTGPPDPGTWQAVLNAAAQGRIERAARWASWSKARSHFTATTDDCTQQRACAIPSRIRRGYV